MINTFVIFSSYLNLYHLFIFIYLLLYFYFISIISALIFGLFYSFIRFVIICHICLFSRVRMCGLMLGHRLLLFLDIFSLISMIFFVFWLIFYILLFGHLNALGVLITLLLISCFFTSLVSGCFGLLSLYGI